MKKIFILSFVLSILIIPFIAIDFASASEVDLLIEKLVDKGVLSPSDAKSLVKEIQKENAKQKVKAEEAKGNFEIPNWVKTIKPFGDLRLRHDTQWKRTNSGDTNRNRERFRLRFGFKVKTTDTTEMGVRLVSGSGFQNTTNQSFDSHGRGKNIFIDRAYGKWKPCKNFTMVGGKVKNPLLTTPLVWDPDVNPEGLAESIKYGINDNISLFANFGQWFIEEQSSTNDDPTLLAYQLGTEIKPNKNIKLQLGATYYDFLKLDRIQSVSDIEDKEEFVGYNHEHGQQMIFDSDGRLLNEFRCLEFAAKMKFKKVLPVPFSIFGDYIVNLDADICDLQNGTSYTDSDGNTSDPADLLDYGSDDRDTGWLIGFDFGNKKKKGDWYAKYHYQVLEDYAFPAVFVDSDFHGGGTNNEGHYINARYLLADNIQLKATGFITEREDKRKDGKKDENRIQLDVVFDF